MPDKDMVETFESKVAGQAQRLTNQKWWRLERAVATKRLAWFSTSEGQALLTVQPTPRGAFEALCFSYMGISPTDLTVVSETQDEIIWESANPCPTLEASGQARLDTRAVCRGVYERPTQSFLSRLDPELRFFRDYSRIRPQAQSCREGIRRVPFAPMMRLALEQALLSKAEGNKGYGAVVAMGGRVLAAARDTAATSGDPSRHAEMTALRLATASLKDQDLCGAMLFSTCEPCPMCAGMAVWCNVTSLVYGASIAETTALGRTRIDLSARTMVDKAPALIEVIGSVLREECLKLYDY